MRISHADRELPLYRVLMTESEWSTLQMRPRMSNKCGLYEDVEKIDRNYLRRWFPKASAKPLIVLPEAISKNTPKLERSERALLEQSTGTARADTPGDDLGWTLQDVGWSLTFLSAAIALIILALRLTRPGR